MGTSQRTPYSSTFNLISSVVGFYVQPLKVPHWGQDKEHLMSSVLGFYVQLFNVPHWGQAKEHFTVLDCSGFNLISSDVRFYLKPQWE